jgi:peptidyl-tRNA hydrolase
MTIGAVLGPLAARYHYWLSLDPREVTAEREEAAEDIRAMQLILRMERDQPPVWSSALMASCRAAAHLCLDPRSHEGGEWHDAIAQYVAGHIRKVTRRARTAHWDAILELPGETIDVNGTQVRALLPDLVVGLDKRVSRLQVGGTDVDIDLPAEPEAGTPDRGALLLLVAEDVSMTTGKLMAQTGHAGMIAAALLAETDPSALVRWAGTKLPVSLRRLTAPAWQRAVAAAGSEKGWDDRLVAVRDAGFTEIDPGTITVVADASAL